MDYLSVWKLYIFGSLYIVIGEARETQIKILN